MLKEKVTMIRDDGDSLVIRDTLLDTKDETFPKYGVKLSYFQEFITFCSENLPEQRQKVGGSLPNHPFAALRGYTITYFCEKIIKPLTKEKQCSLCEFLSDQDHPSIGIANCYVSYSWKMELLDLVETLFEHDESKKRKSTVGRAIQSEEEDLIIWFDLFSLNQHEPSELTHVWLNKTLRSVMDSFNHTLFILSPYDNPIPLTRAWCLWELYCSIDTECYLEFLMNSREKGKLFDDIYEHYEQAPLKILSSVQSEKSEAFLKDDKQCIHETIQSIVGFPLLNHLISEKLQEWLITLLSDEIEKAKQQPDLDPSYCLHIQVTLAILLKDSPSSTINKTNDKSLKLLEKSLSSGKQLYLKEDQVPPSSLQERSFLLKAMYQLALVYYDEGKIDLAEKLVLDAGPFLPTSSTPSSSSASAYQIPNAIVQPTESKELLQCMSLYASILQSKGLFVEAEKLFQETFDKQDKLLGKYTLDTLKTLYNLGSFYVNCKLDFSAAETLLEECRKRQRTFLGPNHVFTLQTLNTLSICYEKQGKTQLVESCLRELYKKYKSCLSLDNPLSLAALNNLALFYFKQEDYIQSEVLWEDCFQRQKKILGENNEITLVTMSNLAFLYRIKGKYFLSESIYIDCLEKYRQILGNLHPSTLTTMRNFADLLLQSQTNLVFAESLVMECLKGFKTLSLISPGGLSYVPTTSGKITEKAQEMKGYGRSDSVASSPQKLYNLEVIRSMNLLGVIYHEQKKYALGESMFQDALEKATETIGKSHAETKQIQKNLLSLQKHKSSSTDCCAEVGSILCYPCSSLNNFCCAKKGRKESMPSRSRDDVRNVLQMER
jgi:tetratricopeptide (TPR) repeat protein